jgi:hypothetical protein
LHGDARDHIVQRAVSLIRRIIKKAGGRIEATSSLNSTVISHQHKLIPFGALHGSSQPAVIQQRCTDVTRVDGEPQRENYRAHAWLQDDTRANHRDRARSLVVETLPSLHVQNQQQTWRSEHKRNIAEVAFRCSEIFHRLSNSEKQKAGPQRLKRQTPQRSFHNLGSPHNAHCIDHYRSQWAVLNGLQGTQSRRRTQGNGLTHMVSWIKFWSSIVFASHGHTARPLLFVRRFHIIL